MNGPEIRAIDVDAAAAACVCPPGEGCCSCAGDPKKCDHTL